jgi:hypothetical protein
MSFEQLAFGRVPGQGGSRRSGGNLERAPAALGIMTPIKAGKITALRRRLPPTPMNVRMRANDEKKRPIHAPGRSGHNMHMNEIKGQCIG